MILYATTTQTTSTSTTSFDTCNGIRYNTTGIRVAGDGTEGSNPSQLKEPRCVYVDANDTVYVCDTINARIQKWTKGAVLGTTVAGGSEGANSNQLKKPRGLTFDQNGNMYVADTENHRVQRFRPPSNIGTTVAGSTTGSSGNSDSLLDLPTNVVVDNSGNLYITDYNNKRVMKYPSNTSSGIIAFGSVSFSKPYGIAFQSNSTNQFYVSDEGNKNAAGWTSGVSTPSATYGSSSTFNQATSVAVDWYNNLYVADTNLNRVTMFCVGSSTEKTVIGGTSGSTPSLIETTGIAFDSKMNLYVTSKTPPAVYKYLRI
ncbi:unnamed protein product [Rotaria socialis]|uniref:NHL repeat containing protein n=1 Tax=Rotaria socialis TaxID=392032 RepID=A0A818ZIL9_9BILA|nr:unnamed protein product [Rotaria socialis]